MIRPAWPGEAEAISALAVRSKAHWKYTSEQMAVFRPELTVSPEQIPGRRAHVLEEAGRLIGFYTLLPRDARVAELEHLFVEPTELGRGVGAALFHHACGVAFRAGFRDLVIQSDPNAVGFYRAMGARLEREIPSSIPGRTIPYFAYSLVAVGA